MGNVFLESFVEASAVRVSWLSPKFFDAVKPTPENIEEDDYDEIDGKKEINWSREMSRLQSLKPSPAAKALGKEPDPAMAETYKKAMSAWTSAYSKASKLQKDQLVRSNAQFHRKQAEEKAKGGGEGGKLEESGLVSESGELLDTEGSSTPPEPETMLPDSAGDGGDREEEIVKEEKLKESAMRSNRSNQSNPFLSAFEMGAGLRESVKESGGEPEGYPGNLSDYAVRSFVGSASRADRIGELEDHISELQQADKDRAKSSKPDKEAKHQAGWDAKIKFAKDLLAKVRALKDPHKEGAQAEAAKQMSMVMEEGSNDFEPAVKAVKAAYQKHVGLVGPMKTRKDKDEAARYVRRELSDEFNAGDLMKAMKQEIYGESSEVQESGADNFGGKKAPPFGKGGKSSGKPWEKAGDKKDDKEPDDDGDDEDKEDEDEGTEESASSDKVPMKERMAAVGKSDKKSVAKVALEDLFKIEDQDPNDLTDLENKICRNLSKAGLENESRLVYKGSYDNARTNLRKILAESKSSCPHCGSLI